MRPPQRDSSHLARRRVCTFIACCTHACAHGLTTLPDTAAARASTPAACWSPTRPAVLYLADQSGSLEVWDLLDRSHEPSIRVTLAATPIMSLSFNPMPTSASAAQQAAQQLLAVGDATGAC